MITRVKLSSIRVYDLVDVVCLTDPDIGGVPDTGVDNTAAMALALTRQLPIIIPPGIFNMSPFTIPDGVNIFGYGPQSQLRLLNASNAIFITMGTRTRLNNLWIDGNKANQLGAALHAVSINNISTAKIDSCTIVNSLSDGINLTGSTTNNIEISSCDIRAFVGNGITVDQGMNITLDRNTCRLSDSIAFPGDGISLSPSNNIKTVTQVTITNCNTSNNVGRGLVLIGNGAQNVNNILVATHQSAANISHGIHLNSVTKCALTTCNATQNTQDGIRVEANSTFNRFSNCLSVNNLQFGIREVINGATPNNNGFTYNVNTGNANNTTTLVGGSSFTV